MVDPFTKRQATDREFTAKLRTDLESARRKIEEQDYAMSKIEARLGTFDEVFKKIADLVSIIDDCLMAPIQDNTMQLSSVKTENELARFKNELDMRGKEIESLFKKEQLNVMCNKVNFFSGQNIRLYQRRDTGDTRKDSYCE